MKSLDKKELKELLNKCWMTHIAETDHREIKSTEDLKAVIEIAGDLYFPEEHKCEIEILDRDCLLGHILECYVCKMVSRAGTTHIRQCAAKTRFDSWLEALGLEGETITDKNTDHCNGTCKIVFRIKW